MNPEKLESLRIDPTRKRRSRAVPRVIFALVAVVTAVALYVARPWARDDERVLAGTTRSSAAATNGPGPATAPASPTPALPRAAAGPTNAVLTVSGYIINRERIELSPRFLGVVTWIGVRKGDAVTNGQVVVLLDGAEYTARLNEAEARHERARIQVMQAELDYERARALVAVSVEMKKAEDDARLALAGARAAVREVEGQIELLKTYLEWTVIRSPINGVVLEKLVDPNELVTPQSFGGTRGPSTALISVADPNELQVEIDLNETDVAKVHLNQRCRVSPEAYPDRAYDGYVAEIAPEANRQKGTLQVKVQVVKPDKYLTPELTARVDFLADAPR
jgi:HlyD family secretion protein